MKPRYAARRSTTRRTAFLPFALLALAALLPAGTLQAAGLDPDEERIAQFVIEHTERTMHFLDPGARGAADIAFVAHQVEAGLDGLGPSGSGSHTSEELIDLRSIPKAAQRAAILMYRLTR